MINHKQQGLSLIELMIAIVIASVLLMIGANSYSAWIQNQQVRVAADAMLNGMQMTRAEAVRRNASVRMVLCNVPSSSWEILATSAAASLPAASLVCPASSATVGEQRVQERSAMDGSRNAVVTVTPNTTTTITFNGLGRVIANSDATQSITQIDVSNPKSDHPLRVTVSSGGSVRMCDPSITLAANDPRKC